MKLVPECTETGLQPCICPIPRNHRETPNRTYYDENTNILTTCNQEARWVSNEAKLTAPLAYLRVRAKVIH